MIAAMDSNLQFAADIPQQYDRILGPFWFAPYARDMAERVRSVHPRRVLEIACGTGVLTDHLRRALPDQTELTATDLNAPMIERARSKLGDAGIRWRVADGARLPFDDRSVDAVVCQFGYMFFPDKVAGFREAARVLAPDGHLFFSVWSSLHDNPSGRIPHEAAVAAFATDPPQFYRVPFGYHDEAEIQQHLSAAGFRTIVFDRVVLDGNAPSAAVLATGMVRGTPLYNALVERHVNIEALESEVARRLAAAGGSSPFSIRLDAKIITARLQ
jgi:ubiquinone/menaquinone biosynthesis C-methylase UbiE